MYTISEKELSDAAKNGALSVLKVVRSPDPDDDGWCVFANVKWKKGDFLLITQKRKPRIWRNMDRLLRHIEVNYREIGSLAVFFRGEANGQSLGPAGEEVSTP